MTAHAVWWVIAGWVVLSFPAAALVGKALARVSAGCVDLTEDDR